MKGQKVIIISENMTGCGVWDTVIMPDIIQVCFGKM